MSNNKFKIGEKVLVTNQYFLNKKIIDMPIYGKVIDIDEKNNQVRLEDKNGDIYTIDAFMCERDNITALKGKEIDSKQDKEIKRLLNVIAHEVDVDNRDEEREIDRFFDDYLFADGIENKRMINELNLRRALEKYLEFGERKIKSNLNDEALTYQRRKKMYNIADEVTLYLDIYGIFTETRSKSREKDELERRIMIEEFKKAKSQSQASSSQDGSLSNLLTSIVALEFLNNAFGLDNENNNDNEKENNDNNDFFISLTGLQNTKHQNKKADLPDCLIDMTELASKGKYNDIIGREDELDTVAETLARKEIRNPLLIGKPGAGKTAVVEELVKRSYEGKIEHLKNKHFYELRMNDLVAGTMYRGQLEQKLKDVMKVLEDDKDVVLFIDEVHMIVQAGSTAEDKNDVANALKPYLTSEISIIGATTFDEYKCTFENDGALARRFNPIIIEEKTKEEVIDIICKVKERFENYHNVELSNEMIENIVDEIYSSKLDNSLIAGALTAVDTICTKMKIKHLTEKQAFDKWSNEVVLGVDRTNKGGKTGKIGFSFEEDNEVVNEKINDEKILVEKDNLLNEDIKVIDNELESIEEYSDEELDDLIEAIEDLDNTYVIDSELEDFNDTKIPNGEQYIALTGDVELKHYDDFIIDFIENRTRDIILEDEEENDNGDDESL